jgi:hypothetical protein
MSPPSKVWPLNARAERMIAKSGYLQLKPLKASASTVRRLIASADRLLPGVPAPKGETDDRWQAIMRVEDHVELYPELIWKFVLKWGRHPQEDLRDAIAVLLVEHLLEHHFNLIYPRLCEEVGKSKRFADMVGRCYWLGEGAWAANARKLDRLVGKARPRFHPRRAAPAFSSRGPGRAGAARRELS